MMEKSSVVVKAVARLNLQSVLLHVLDLTCQHKLFVFNFLLRWPEVLLVLCNLSLSQSTSQH